MVKVMMYGCNGYMGHVICNLIKDMENVTVAAGIDPCPGDQKDFPVFASLDECNVEQISLKNSLHILKKPASRQQFFVLQICHLA